MFYSNIFRAGHRSFRGSVKIKQTYEHLKENGDLGTMNRTSASRRAPDIDIKLLQAKRQQAEMRRYCKHLGSCDCISYEICILSKGINERKICVKIIRILTLRFFLFLVRVNSDVFASVWFTRDTVLVSKTPLREKNENYNTNGFSKLKNKNRISM